MTALRAAQDWGKAPHLFWGLPGERWTSEDYLLATAFTLVNADRCQCGCGGYVDECLDPERQDEWADRIREKTHFRGAALEQYRKDHKEDVDRPGAFVYIEDRPSPAPTPVT